MPVNEDWYLIRAFTGHEPSLAGWLWTQNNEHRVPLPKLVMLALLKLGGGEFRLVQLLNVWIMAGCSGLLILTARKMRQGRTRFADACFPPPSS